MSWRPSQDKSLAQVKATSFWTAIEPLYDDAVPLAPLPRHNWDALKNNYIPDRKVIMGQDVSDINALLRSPAKIT